jgi:ABC-type branched-subunit amino acid transport system substrate-binding protein
MTNASRIAESSKSRLALLLSTAALALAALLAPGLAVGADDKTVTIGVISGFSGPFAGPGEDQWRGIQLAAEEINAQGGILGKQIKLVRRDDKINPGEAGKMAQDLIQNEKPDFIVGANSAGTVLPHNDAAKKAGIPYIAIAQNDRINTAADRGAYSFHEAVTPTLNGRSMSKWIVNNLGKKVYFLMADYAFGKDTYASMSKAVAEAGGTEAGLTYFPLGTTDFTPFIAKVRAAKADVVVCGSFGNDSINLLKQVQRFGLTKESKFFFPVVDLMMDMATGFENLAGSYGAANFYWELADKNPTAKKFVDAYTKKWGAPPSGYAGYAYSAMHVIKKGTDKAKSLEPAKFAKALEGMEYDFYKGKSWIRACDHQTFQPLFVVKGRTAEEAKKAGREQYGLREVVGTVEANEATERSCKELGYTDERTTAR